MKNLIILICFVFAVAFSNCTGFRESCATYDNVNHARVLHGKKVYGSAYDSNIFRNPSKRFHKKGRKQNMRAVRGDFCKAPRKRGGFLGLF